MPEVHEKVLQFDTGLVTNHLNDQCDVVFNPTDSVFVERLYAAFNDLDKKQEAYQEQVSRMSDRAKIFDLMRERDKEMRELVDSVFDGTPVCAMLFGSMNVYAMASGLPVWANLMLAIMEEVDTAFAREQKATNPRVQKYMAKYRKK